MTEELRFAVKCSASRQRPVLRRQCSKCLVGSTYVPSGLEVPIETNGVLTGLFDFRKSPVNYEYDVSSSR